MVKFPILIIIPHGGYRVPEEFVEHSTLNETDLMLSADTCANEIFSIENCAAVLNTHISRLFIDLDRPPAELPPRALDGVMKTESFLGNPLFSDGKYPDSIALANILRRYYFPFSETLSRIITSGEVIAAIECHTVSAVGIARATDRDRPRPVVSVQYLTEKNDHTVETAPRETAELFLTQFRKIFAGEDCAADSPFILSETPVKGHLMREYSGSIPYLRINLSRGLFLDDAHFNYHYGKVDQIRIADLKRKFTECIERGAAKI
jgi:N-formylglutamate deformylase